MTGVATPARRRYRTPLVVGLVALVAVVGYPALGGSAPSGDPLGPDNPSRDGAQALARVLDQQGVQVVVVRSADALEQTPVDGHTTVLVTSTDRLGSSTIERLMDHAAAGHVVLVEPGLGVTEALGLAPGTPLLPEEAVPADCAGTQFADLAVETSVATAYPSPQGCFRGEGGYLIGFPRSGLVLLGASDILSNRNVTDSDNAAVALRLLGEQPRLVWYVPDLADLGAGDGVSLGSLLPRWLAPALWLLLLAWVALMLWRGRRLGPLATEPLPVVVKAIETTQARGRLYRKANDRGHAAGVLRAAARSRLAAQLRLPAHDPLDPGALAQQLAQHLAPLTGRPAGELTALLHPASPPPVTDRDLIDLATRLDELDREVRRT